MTLVVSKAPVLHLRFDEGSGAVASDSSGAGNHGAVTGATWIAGKYGKALSFAGVGSGNIVNIPRATNVISGFSAMTIAFWMNITAYTTGYSGLVADLGGDKSQRSFAVTQEDAVGRVYCYFSDGVHEQSVTNNGLASGIWIHYACTFNANDKICVYINGVLTQSPATTLGTLNVDARNLLIGAYITSGHSINGIIDEAQIFNRALSAQEIMDLYMSAPPKWIITYFDGVRWVEVPHAQFDGSSEELDGHEELTFVIPNTTVNRAFILNHYPVKVYFDGLPVFDESNQMVMKLRKYSMTQLAVTCYNQVYETLQKRAFTGAYDSVAASVILDDITGVGGAGGSQTFGCAVAYETEDYTVNGVKEGPRYQMLNLAGYSLTSLYAYVRYDSAPCNVKMAVYADVAGLPGALLGVSNEINVANSSKAWIQFPFASPIAMTANAFYWFMFMTDGYIEWGSVWNDTIPHKGNSNTYAAGFSNPFGTPGVTPDYNSHDSVYAVVASAASPGGTCPSTPVSAKYDKTNSYDAAAGLAKNLTKDFWGNQYFNIGVRNRCVLCLPFEDGSGYKVTDVSGYGNDGAVYPAGGSFTFGRLTAGSEDISCTANYKYASKFTCNGTGVLNSLTARLKRNSSSGNVKLALYADSSGSPGAWIATTTAVSVGTSMAWVTFPFDPAGLPSVVSGTSYWFAVLTDAAYTVRAQGAVPVIVQSARGVDVDTGIAVSLSATPQSGNVLIAVVAADCSDGVGAVSSIVQGGVTWTHQTDTNEFTDSYVYENLEIWYGIIGDGASKDLVVNLAYGAYGGGIVDVFEVSGMAVSSFLDKHASNGDIHSDSHLTDTGTTASTTQNDEIWIGATLVEYETQSTPTHGFTLYDGAFYTWISLAVLIKIVSATATANSGTTTHYSNNVPWLGLIATFKAASAGNIKYNADTYSNGFADPFGALSTTANKELCIYASGFTPLPSWVDGKYGKALSFNGSTQYVSVTDVTNLQIVGAITLCAWIKTSSTAKQAVITKSGAYLLYTGTGADGKVHGYLYGTTSSWQGGTTIISDGLWHHIALTYDPNVLANNFILYVDGSANLTATVTGAINNAANRVGIGDRPDISYRDFFNGTIDEAMILNRALTAAEIKFIYSGKPRNCTRVVNDAKVRSAVEVQGVDLDGNKISGTAGTGTDVQVLTQIEPASQDSLDNQAAAALEDLATGNMGAPINVPITVGAYLKPGDTVPIHIDQLAMNGNPRIQKISKAKATATLTFEKPLATVQQLLNEVKAASLQQIANRAGVTFTRDLSTNTPVNPAAGDQWYQTDLQLYFYYNGSSWVQFQPV